MFEDFLCNEETYDSLESFFSSYFEGYVKKMCIKPDEFVSPYYNTRYANGAKIREANPIFSARNKRTGNVCRIVIYNPVRGYAKHYKEIEGGNEVCFVIKIKHLKRARKDLMRWASLQMKNTRAK
ncbi:hypothetical protein [Pseudomonas cremoricolorata]|uniref:hypothetical protein n=1 Tax=Pseudomonas cremoricolorata TaxID=157783 RepID=UPI0012B67073|nr:hypothetical protein [Pseudomonas cremoricolorata]